MDKTGMGWIAEESRFTGPEDVWQALIAQDKKYNRLRWPQHLSYDDLHELFDGNRVTGDYALGFDGRQEDAEEDGAHDIFSDSLRTETQSTHERTMGSPTGNFEIPGSSTIPLGGSSSQSNVPSNEGEPSPSSFGRALVRSNHRRPHAATQEVTNMIQTLLAQPANLSCTHVVRPHWESDYQSLPTVLGSMGLGTMSSPHFFHTFPNFLIMPHNFYREMIIHVVLYC